MSLLYSILKPIVRKRIKGSSMHREESYEEFKQASYAVQTKFRFELPKIRGYEFRDEQLDGSHIIVGKKEGTTPKKALVYFPGGGSRRWQLPYKNSYRNYMAATGAELWIPLFPLLPDHTLMDEAEFTVKVHQRMLRSFKPENIVWLGYSGGADVILMTGRHMTQKYPEIPMPGFMIPVSGSGLLISEASRKRMEEIDARDPILRADMLDTMVKYYDPKGDLPRYILGKADEDDYTGFPKIHMYFAGDEVFAGLAPDYEASFQRSGLTDYRIIIREGMPHGWPVFTFLKEGRDGEREIIKDINKYYRSKIC